MKKTLTAYDLKKAFVEADRDYYSSEGLEALLNYYDELNENMELDIPAICCDCTEYGCTEYDDDRLCTFQNLVNNYGYLYPIKQYLKDKGLSENEFNLSEYVKSLVEVLERKTRILHIPNGNYIVFAF